MKSLRSYISICALALLLCASAAQAASEARQELEATINDVLSALSDPGLHDPGRRDGVLRNVESIVNRMFDYGELSARTVGRPWNSFTPDQQQRFTRAFTELLRAIYLEKLDGYEGESVTYGAETASSDGRRVEIQTTVNIKAKPVPVSYRMLKKQRWVVYDVIIEGVSMVQNYRNQFQDLLARGDAEALISQVNQKAQEARRQNGR